MIAYHASNAVIELCRLHRNFGNTRAVQDVSFSVPRGEVFGYIGPNGAGKTTSMRILATLELPTLGDAFVDGFSVVNDPDHVRRRLGFMPDAFGTYPSVNCEEYIDFYARAYGLAGRQRHQRVRWVMNFTRLDGIAEKPIRGLSKGMKQRLCLGRALVHDPAVLILDEPAAGLDPRARIELRRMIRTLADEGKTVLVSSHILTELAEMCDRVGIIEQGRLLATGSVEEIQRQQRTHRELVVRIIDQQPTAIELLQNDSHVDHLIVDGELLKFQYEGEVADQAALLTRLVQAEVVVAEFSSHVRSLEDVFMQVTEGLVQ